MKALNMKLFSALLLGTAIGLSACAKTEVPETSGIKIAKTEAKASGMVAAANPLATQAGIDILQKGGSAVDAAIAIQAALGLVEPQSSGLGGGAFMVVYDPKDAQVWAYDGRETAPAGASAEMFQDPETGKPVRYFDGIASGRSTGVPGAIVMLHRAHKDYGKIDWAESFEPAIKLADDGFKVSPRMAAMVKRMGAYVLPRDADAKAYFFLDNGETLPEGFVRDNPAYADTLRAIQKNPRALLEGPIAKDIIAKTREEPLSGTLTLADMSAYQPKKSEALCSTYRKHIVCGAQPPASGGIAVQAILGMLENYDMAEMGQSVEGWHHFIEASFLGYADRTKYVADPDFVEVPTAALLNKDYLKSRAALIQSGSAMKDVKAGNPIDFIRGQDATPDSPGTSHFTIVDRDGLVVSMTTTVEAPFGSQRMVRGFMLNNQLTDFSFRSVDADGNPIANAPAPGKRPRSSMSPHIVFAPNGEFLFTTGSPGGNSIIAYTAKSIVGMIDWGLSPEEAIELPNVIARRGSVKLEAKGLEAEDSEEIERAGPAAEFGMAPELVEGLEALGHQVVRSKGEISGLHIIYRQPDGTLIGGADPRREGTVETP